VGSLSGFNAIALLTDPHPLRLARAASPFRGRKEGRTEIPMTQRTTPPFRADHVGSLLRTPALKAARERRARNEIDAEAFNAIEDREVADVIAKQEAAGLQLITDGEYRRVSWNIDFLERLDNVESYASERKIKFQTSGPQPRGAPSLDRQARHLQAASHDRALQVLAEPHQADAENDYPVAVVAPFPLRPRCGAGNALSGDGRFLSRSRPILPQGGARFCRRRLLLSATRRGQSRVSLRSVFAQSDRRL